MQDVVGADRQGGLNELDGSRDAENLRIVPTIGNHLVQRFAFSIGPKSRDGLVFEWVSEYGKDAKRPVNPDDRFYAARQAVHVYVTHQRNRALTRINDECFKRHGL